MSEPLFDRNLLLLLLLLLLLHCRVVSDSMFNCAAYKREQRHLPRQLHRHTLWADLQRVRPQTPAAGFA